MCLRAVRRTTLRPSKPQSVRVFDNMPAKAFAMITPTRTHRTPSGEVDNPVDKCVDNHPVFLWIRQRRGPIMRSCSSDYPPAPRQLVTQEAGFHVKQCAKRGQ